MRKDFKENILKILSGVSTGVVIALVPGALINEGDSRFLARCAKCIDDDHVDAKLVGCLCGTVRVILVEV